MVDSLLEFRAEDGFVTFPVNTHDHENTGLSIAEQVTGRKKQVRFQVCIARDQLNVLLLKLQQEFKDTGIRYRVTPVSDNGFF